MKSKELETALKSLNEIIKPLLANKIELESSLRKARSIEWIEVNKVTKEQVQESSAKDLPWFGAVNEFGKWLLVNSDKPYCEWNGRIYLTSEIVRGRMAREAYGIVDDLPE